MGTQLRPRTGRSRIGVILLALVTTTAGVTLPSAATASPSDDVVEVTATSTDDEATATPAPTDPAPTDPASSTDLSTSVPAPAEPPTTALAPTPEAATAASTPTPTPSPSTPAYATRIHGYVSDGYSVMALAGATVTVLHALTGRVLATTTTDSGGEYEVTGLQPTQVKIRAELADHVTTYAYDATTFADAAVLTLLSGDDMLVSLSLAPLPAAVEGQVLSWMDPIGGATVEVIDVATWAVLASVTLGEFEDHYRIENLPPAQVRVRGSKPGYVTSYATGVTGDVFQLLPGQTLQQTWDPLNLYLDIAPEAVVTGVVLADGAPLAGATVAVLAATSGATLGSATTDSTGRYRIGALAGGDVKISATKTGWGTTYANGQSTFASADVFTLMGTQTVSDPQLWFSSGAAITGSVRAISQDPADPYDGPAVGALVTAYDAATGVVLRSVRTDALGTFRLGRLPAGDYKVRAALAGHLTTFAMGRRTLATADVITVATGQTVTLPGELVLWAEAVIEGQVLGWMDPLGGATVSVLDAVTGQVLKQVRLGENEYEYRIAGLPAGQVKVRATKPGWITDFANNRDTFAQADVFTLVPGVTLAQTWSPEVNLYLDLTPEAAISGLVMGFSEYMDDPLAGATVVALDATTGRTLGRAVTDQAGEFRIGGLAAGQIKVRVSAPGFLTTYLDQKSTFATADVYTVEPLVTLDVPGNGAIGLYGEAVIEGSVLSQMDPIGGATVAVLDATTGRVLRAVRLAEDQFEYRIGGLPAGDVKVRATKPGYFPDFANNRDTFAEGDVFTLRSGVTLSQTWSPEANLYLDLEPQAVITGYLMGFSYGENDWDDPVPDVRVAAIDVTTGKVVRTTVTGWEPYGGYRLDGLRAGTYRLRATKDGWLTSFAGPVTVFPGEVSDQGMWSIYGEAVIEGQVLGSFDPLGGATVTVYDATTGLPVKSVRADGDGYYRVTGLGDPYADSFSDFKVRAAKTGWYPQFANGKPSLATADVFTLQHGQVLRQSWDPLVLYLDLSPRPTP